MLSKQATIYCCKCNKELFMVKTIKKKENTPYYTCKGIHLKESESCLFINEFWNEYRCLKCKNFIGIRDNCIENRNYFCFRLIKKNVSFMSKDCQLEKAQLIQKGICKMINEIERCSETISFQSINNISRYYDKLDELHEDIKELGIELDQVGDSMSKLSKLLKKKG